MASDEQFSLCWNNFHANMSAGFHGLLSRGDLVDVTLAAEGRLLQAHKLVLSVCSPYFQEMFKMNPTQHPIVFLKDVSHSALRDLLQFMYQGEVNVKQEELASFISTAEQLQVKGLTGNQNEESSTPSKPKPTSRPGPRSSQQRQSVMTKLETDLDSKPSSTPVAIKRTNRPSIASNNSSSSQSGPAKRKCVDPLEAGPSGSAKEEFVTIPDEDENNAVAPKMEPEFVNESMWDEDDDGTNNDETNFGEDDSNMEMSGFDGSTTGDGNLTGGGEGGAVGDAQGSLRKKCKRIAQWTPENMAAAMIAVNKGHLTPNKAASWYGIPRRTLLDHLKTGCITKCMGRKATLSKEHERELVNRIIQKARNGMSITNVLIRREAFLFCEENQIEHKFDLNFRIAGKSWLRTFVERNSVLKTIIVRKREAESFNYY
ncbi:protein tramtrack, beta isoform isoform X5 [Bicyclus anynana]|uniref:Protein tramtrack, beta isoform isoform X5 n=1 Tax=Bicyclus anynana TaxID=110368 RepID=A0A6J1NG12_BICAN|nr:protein tramtrack, beta isoform isoform X5 [Bicyclus anynana]